MRNKRSSCYIRKTKRKTKETPATQENLLLVVAFHKTLPNIKNVIDKHWHILSTHKKLKNTFDKKPFIACRANNKLHQMIGGNRILKSKVVDKNNENHKQSGKCSPYISRLNNFCCKQVKQTNVLKSYRTNQVFKIFHDPRF